MNSHQQRAAWPYIVMAPDYKESSLGVQVIHRLCHLLNENGHQAWLKPCIVNPQWNTPVIPYDDFLEYTDGGKPFIAIYPEVVTGNPLNAPVAVRYMLNRAGVIEDNEMEAKAEDLFFWYRDEFAEKTFQPNMLALECYDLSLFCDDCADKDLDLLYVNRVPRRKIDFSTLPANIRVLSMDDPLPLSELAAVLKRGRVLYTYESSGTCFLANLCGCPVVARSLAGYQHLAIGADTVRDNRGGIAWSDDADELAAARLTLPQVREWLYTKRKRLDKQLEDFISITQQRAAETFHSQPVQSLANWMLHRAMTPTQRDQLATKIAALTAPASLLIVVRNTAQDPTALAVTLSSLAACRQYYPHLRAVLTETSQVSVMLPDWVSVNSENGMIANAQEQWLQVIDAGCRYFADSFALFACGLNTAENCFALFADEVVELPGGELESALRPDFNLDLVLSTPWRFARRWAFRMEELNSIPVELPVNLVAWELEVITRLIEQYDISGIGHISEPLLAAPQHLLQPDDIDIAVIQRHLQQRGYPHGQVVVNGVQPWRLNYGDTLACAVSIVIPAGDDLNNIQRCVELMLGKTTHENYQIIVVRHAETDELVNGWLDNVMRSQQDKVQVVSVSGVATPAVLYNAGAAAARGDYIVLLTPRVIIAQKNWLTNLLNHAQRPEVGSVGSKIISLDRRVLSAGEVLGSSAFCNAAGFGATVDDGGYMQRLHSDQNYTVLNYSCLMIKKAAWDAVNGMDEGLVTLRQINIDLSLKLRQLGYMSVWTPHSVVVSDDYELYPRSKKLAAGDEPGDNLLRIRWLKQLLRDPAYNDNFAPLRKLFKPEWRQMLHAHRMIERSRPVVLGLASAAGSKVANYHATVIGALQQQGVIHGLVTEDMLDYALINRLDADAIIVESELSQEAFDLIHTLKPRDSRVVSQIVTPAWIAARSGQQPNLSGVDRLIVQNPAQAEALRHYSLPVAIVPRNLPAFTVEEKTPLRDSAKLRVLCNTCELSTADIELVQSLVRELTGEVCWQILGPLPAAWLPWIDEHYRYPGHQYFLPLLGTIETELAIVPRADNKFNRLKDNFSLLELAACAIPALVSDVGSLHSHIPTLRARNRKADWLEAIRQAASERRALLRLGRSAQHALRSEDWLADNNVAQHLRAWLS